MKKIFRVLVLMVVTSYCAIAQNSVGINTSTPNSKAVLELVSPNNNQGFLVPRITTAQRTTMTLTTTDQGMMVYDTNLNQFWHWNGSQWKAGLGVLGETAAAGDLNGTFPTVFINDDAVGTDELTDIASAGTYGGADNSTVLEIVIDVDGRVHSIVEKQVTVGTTHIVDASILNEDLADNVITISKLNSEGNVDKVLATQPDGTIYWEDRSAFTSSTLSTNNIYVGDATGVATGMPVVGDVTVTNDGTQADISINPDGVTADKINPDVAGEGVIPNTTTGALDINAGNGVRVVSDSLEIAIEEIDGDGIVADLANGELDINVDNSTVETASDVLRVKPKGITNAEIADFTILPEAKLSPANPITGVNYQNRILVINEASEVDWQSIGQSTVLTTTSSGAIFGRPLSDFATNSLLPGAIFIGDGSGNAQQLAVSGTNNILVGNGTGLSSVTLVGDASIVNPSGLIEIQNNAVQGDDIDATSGSLNIAGIRPISITTSATPADISSPIAIQLNATAGSIDIRGSQGVLIDATSNDIDINAISGSLNLTSNQGVLIDADNNDIDLDAISGSVNIDGNQNITLTSNNVAINPTNNANITTTSGVINLNSGSAIDISGDNTSSFTTSVGDIDISPAGQLDLDGGTTVAIDGATGVTVSSTDNDVTVTADNNATTTATNGTASLNSTNGEVDLTAGTLVDINANNGNVTIDAPAAGSDIEITADDQITLDGTNTQVVGAFQINGGTQITDITTSIDATGDNATLATEKAVRDALNSSITADNGLNESTDGNIQLGGDLTVANTTITQGAGEALTIANTGDANTTISLTGTGDFVIDGITEDVTVDQDGLLTLGNGVTVTGGTVDLGNDAIQASEISTGAVASDEILDNSITADDINTSAVTTDEILNGTILEIDLADDAVTTNKIINDAVTLDKLGTAGAADGNKIYITDAAGDPTFADISTFTTTILAEGSIYVGDAGGNASEVDAKTDGNILVGDGTTLNSVGVTGDVTIDNAGDIQIKTDAVTAVEIATDAVGSDEIINGSIETIDLNDDVVTAAKINADVAGAGLSQNGSGALEVDLSAVGGDGVTDLGSDGDLDLDINGLANSVATVQDVDLLAIYDNDGALVGKISRQAFIESAAIGNINVDGGDISGTDVTLGAVNTLDVSAGTFTLANDQISGNAVDGGTISNASVTGAASVSTTALTASGAVDLGTNAIESTEITDGTIATIDITNDAITAAKINADVAGTGLVQNAGTGALEADFGNLANSLAGNGLADDGSDGTLDVQVETGPTATLEISSNILRVRDGGISAAQILDDAVTTNKILDGAVVTGSIQDETILSDDIRNGTIATIDIANNAITSGLIADGNILTDDIADGTILTEDIATSAITTALIANGTITFQDIADNGITLAKIADGLANQILATDASGNPTYIDQSSVVVGTASDLVASSSVVSDAEVDNDLTINGGSINNTPIGVSGRSNGNFVNLDATGSLNIAGLTTLIGNVELGDGPADIIDITGVTNLNGGSVTIASDLTLASGSTVNNIVTSVGVTGSDSNLPTEAAVRSAISANSITNGEGTSANGTSVNIGGGNAFTSSRVIDLDANNLTIDATAGGNFIVDGVAGDVTVDQNGLLTAGNGVTATGTVQGATLTDGVASINSGAITNATNITGSGTITGATLTDGSFSTTSGAVTGVTTLNASGTASVGNLSTTGNVDLDGTLQFDAGQTVNEITTTVDGSSTDSQLPTAAAVNSAISATALTDGEGTTANGTAIDLGGTLTGDATLLVDGNSLIVDNNGGAGTFVVEDGTGLDVTTIGDNQITVTDGATTTTIGVNSLSTGGVSATGTVQGATLTDGVASINSGAITNATNITGSGTITGATLTDGSFSTTSGAVTGVTTLNASGTASVGNLSTTGNVDLDGTLQFDAGQTVNEITTTVDGSSTDSQLPTAAAVNSAISATALTDGEGTTANGTAIDLGGTLTGDATLLVDGNSLIVDNNGGAGTLVVEDGTGLDVTTIGDNQITVTDGATTTTIGVNSLNTGGVTATGTVQGATLTDGVASINSGAITNATNITGSGTITGATLTDGSFSTTSGAVTGVTTLNASGTASVGNLSTTGNVDLDGTLQFDAGQTVNEITTTVDGSSTDSQLPTAAAVNSAISATALTDGEGTTANGTAIDLGGTLTGDATLLVDGNSLIVDNNGGAGTFVVEDGTGLDVTTIGDNQITVTDGATTTTIGVNSLSTGGVSATGTVQGATLTDGVASINSGAITNATNITGSGTITGATLTDGSFSTTSGAVTGVTTLNASGTASVGNLSTTGNVDLDGTLQFDAGQTVNEITTTVDGSSTDSQLPTAAAVNSAISATALTDGEGTTANGTAIDLGGTLTGDATLLVDGNSLIVDNNGGAGTFVVEDGTGLDVTTIGDNQITVTDGATTTTIGVNSLSTGGVSATGTVQGATLTDGVASINSGAITNATNITGSGTITGATLTDGSFSTTSGAVTGVTTLNASGTASVGNLSTTGNVDLDGTLQFDAGQTVNEITTTVDGSSTDSQLPTAAAVNSAISATALTDGEGTTANGTAIDLGGTLTGDATLLVDGNSLIVDNNGGAGTFVVEDGTGLDVTTIGDNQITVTDGATTTTIGVNSLSTGGVSATGTVQGATLTDGVASINSGAITNATNITGSGTITGATLTDGSFSTTSGAVTGVTTLNASGTASVGNLSTTGNVDLDGTLQFDAGQTVNEITTTVDGSSTDSQLPTAAAVNSAISATALTDGEGTTANGTAIDLGGTLTGDATLLVDGNSLIVDNNGGAGTFVVEDGTGLDVTTIGDNQITVTDGATTTTIGVNSLSTGGVSATGTVQGATLTDGVASINSGAITNATNITGSGTITGATLTDGSFSTTSGAVTGVTTLNASGTASVGNLSTTGNVDLDGTLQFDAGQTVNEITTTVDGSSTDSQLPTAAAVNSAISATALTDGEGTTANGTAIDLGGTLTGDATLLVDGNSLIVDNNGGAGTLVVEDGTGLDVTTIGDNQITVTDGATTTTIGVNSLNTGGVTATGTVQGATLTDGVASINSGAITNATNITGSGTITGATLTDGSFSTTSGAVTGVTTLNASGTASVGNLSTTGNVDLDGTLQFDAGQTVNEITTTVDGSSTDSQLPTAAAVNSAISATALTDGEGTTANGTAIDLGGTLTGDATLTVDGNSLIVDNNGGAGTLVVEDGTGLDVTTIGDNQITVTDGATTTTIGVNSLNTGGVTATGTVQGATLTDGVASINSGAITNATNITGSGTITGATLTDGSFSTTSGAVTGVTTLNASGTASVGNLSTTGNVDLDGTLQFDAGQTVNEITTTVDGSSTDSQLPTAAAVNSAISATALTDGEGTTANGTAIDLGGTLTGDATLLVDGNSLIVDNNGGAGTFVVEDGTGLDVTTIGDNQITVTDGATTTTIGVNSLNTGGVTATGTVQGATLTDGVASINSGAITNATNITGSGTITGATLTDGSFSTTSGAVTGVTTLNASGTASVGNLSTTGNVDLDGTLQFDAGQTVNEITTTVDGSSTDSQLPTAAAVNSAISATALTDGEGTTANGTAIDLGGTLTGDATLTVDGNSLIVDNNGGAGTLVVEDGTGLDVTTIGDNQITVTDGATTTTIGVNSLNTGGVTATGTVQGATLTDGVASINSGAITNATNITGSGTITGATLTDGSFSTTSGAVTGVTTLNASGTASVGNLSTTGNVDLDGTLQFDAGQTVDNISIATDLGAAGANNTSLSTQLAVKTYVDNQVGAISVSLQDAYDGGNTIVTSGGNTLDISGPEAISLDAQAASNFTVDGANLALSTTTSGVLDLDGAGGVTVDAPINNDITLTTSGTGRVVVPLVEISVGTIDNTVIGGTGAAAGTFTTLSGTTQTDGGNLRLSGNVLSSTDANGNITFTPNGTGAVISSANFDASNGIDVTGDITVTGNVDGVDIAALGTNVANLISLTGLAANSSNLGTFTGTIISDNTTIVNAFQELETDVDAIQTLSGVAAEATNLGTFNETIISDNVDIKVALQELETSLALGGSTDDQTLQEAYAFGNSITTNSTDGAFTVGGTQSINLGNDANTGAVNIGTAGARAINIGSTSATAVNISAGNNGISMSAPLTSTSGLSAEVTGGLSISSNSITLSSTGTTIQVQNRSFLIIQDSHVGATTFNLSNGVQAGQVLVITLINGAGAGSANLTLDESAGNVNLSGRADVADTWDPEDTGDTLTLIWNGSDWLEVSRSYNY
ncbi:MAG: hypothetical protein ACFHWX_08275 [Bacteroidota bacterium]